MQEEEKVFACSVKRQVLFSLRKMDDQFFHEHCLFTFFLLWLFLLSSLHFSQFCSVLLFIIVALDALLWGYLFLVRILLFIDSSAIV